MDDEYIQDLLAWTTPAVTAAYSEEENLTMLRLPRKECAYTSPRGGTQFDLSLLV